MRAASCSFKNFLRNLSRIILPPSWPVILRVQYSTFGAGHKVSLAGFHTPQSRANVHHVGIDVVNAVGNAFDQRQELCDHPKVVLWENSAINGLFVGTGSGCYNQNWI